VLDTAGIARPFFEFEECRDCRIMRPKTQTSEHVVLRALRIVFFLVVVSLCEHGHAVTVADRDSSDVYVTPYPAPLLSLSVHGVKRVYRKTDSVQLRVILKNESASNMYVLGLAGWTTSVSLSLQDHATGEDVSTSFIPFLLPPPPHSARDFLKLTPGGYVEGKVGFSLSDYELKAGHKYDLLVQYQSAVPKEMGFGLNVYSSERPAIVAHPVSIEIVSH
jgi:hypothetical protein